MIDKKYDANAVGLIVKKPIGKVIWLTIEDEDTKQKYEYPLSLEATHKLINKFMRIIKEMKEWEEKNK